MFYQSDLTTELNIRRRNIARFEEELMWRNGGSAEDRAELARRKAELAALEG